MGERAPNPDHYPPPPAGWYRMTATERNAHLEDELGSVWCPDCVARVLAILDRYRKT